MPNIATAVMGVHEQEDPDHTLDRQLRRDTISLCSTPITTAGTGEDEPDDLDHDLDRHLRRAAIEVPYLVKAKICLIDGAPLLRRYPILPIIVVTI